MERRKLTSDETAALAARLEKLFPDSGWTVEQFDLFRRAVAPYSLRAAIDGLDDYRMVCRYKTPVPADIIEAVKRRQSPHEQSKQATEIERLRRSAEEYERTKARESRVSRTLHIPELLDRGEEAVLRTRDELIARMGHVENFSQRNVAGCPTWTELTDPDDERARIMCWRYWIIMGSFDAFEPEVCHT